MDLTTTTATTFLEHAFAQLLAVADRLGDPLVGVRPIGPSTNSVAALVVHCCGVAEYWLGHVAAGEPTTRDRAAELSAAPPLDALHELVATTSAACARHLDRLELGLGRPVADRIPLYGGDRSDAAIVLHVLEECFQHLGHAELTADVLAARPATPANGGEA